MVTQFKKVPRKSGKWECFFGSFGGWLGFCTRKKFGKPEKLRKYNIQPGSHRFMKTLRSVIQKKAKLKITSGSKGKAGETNPHRVESIERGYKKFPTLFLGEKDIPPRQMGTRLDNISIGRSKKGVKEVGLWKLEESWKRCNGIKKTTNTVR